MRWLSWFPAYEGNQGHHANNDIGRRVLDTYFELKKKRLEGNMNPEQPIQEIEEKEEGTELLEEIEDDNEE
ncbi:hypothetical protein JCM21738_2879 [Mesobacillus boroniphilus JCM 21738]|uniref:Uncharacterized protein n=1 Tax=Mesobacillus boroniphilus JCM 21738 TaxID=1294265 RepID=W4RPI5_9BACI|nr:hypothetical protein JCM21738_2879 [Mesobacillus boroniphilus JCM 21738]